MNAQPLQTADAPPRFLTAVSGHAGQTGVPSLTRVSLALIDKRLDVFLRFGEPAHTIRLNHWRRIAVFVPGAVFCRMRWQANDSGAVRWQLMVMEACRSLDEAQHLPGVLPGARLLLRAEGEAAVRAVLQHIDGIEARGIVPAAVSPAYWRRLGNRLAVRLPLPTYNAAGHDVWLATEVLP